jgi:hypothetical protein
MQVAWIYMERSAILTVQNHVITRNPRISVSHDQHHTWNLHISSIQESDRGGYMSVIHSIKCQMEAIAIHSSSLHLLDQMYIGAKSTQRLPKLVSATSPSSVSANSTW